MNISARYSAHLGIQRNLAVFENAAKRVALNPFDTRIIKDISDMKLAEYGLRANVAVLKTANSMSGQLIDLLA